MLYQQKEKKRADKQANKNEKGSFTNDLWFATHPDTHTHPTSSYVVLMKRTFDSRRRSPSGDADGDVDGASACGAAGEMMG